MNIQNQLHPLPLGERWGEGEQIAQNTEMTVDDFNYIPLNYEGLPAPTRQAGGLLKVRELFGKDLEPLISELNGYLIA